MKYSLKCHLGGFGNYNYSVYDEHDKLIYKATENGFLGCLDRLLGSIIEIGHTIYFKDLDNNNLLALKKYWSLFKSNYDIIFRDTKFTVQEGSLLKKAEITVKSTYSTYKITGDITAHNFSIKENNSTKAIVQAISGHIHKVYEITVLENDFEKLAIAMALMLDNIYNT